MKKIYEKQLEEIQEKIDSYDYDNAVCDIINLANETGNEEIVQDIIDQSTAEEIAKNEIETGGLVRLYYFLGNVNFGCCGDFLKLDGYGNLEELDSDSIETLLEELKDALE